MASAVSTLPPNWQPTPVSCRPHTPAADAYLMVACSWQCNKWLRWALIEASWSAIQFSGYFGSIYRCARARGKNKNIAITMVAHRMIKIIWLLLTERRPYTETLPDRSEDGMTVVVRRKVLGLAS